MGGDVSNPHCICRSVEKLMIEMDNLWRALIAVLKVRAIPNMRLVVFRRDEQKEDPYRSRTPHSHSGMQVELSPPSLPPLDVLRHVVDVHCHPTDSDVTTQAMDNLAITICAMSSRPADQSLVRDLANAYPEKVVPCFGQQLHAVSLAFSNHSSKLG